MPASAKYAVYFMVLVQSNMVCSMLFHWAEHGCLQPKCRTISSCGGYVRGG